MSLEGFLTRLVEPLTGMWSAPGSPLRLRRPDGFEPTDAFPGLIQPGASGSIMVQSLPGPYGEIVPGFTRDALVGRGLTPGTDESVDIEGRPARLMRCTQTAAGIEFDKWILIIDADGQTILVMATWPVAHAELTDVMRQTLLGARFSPDEGKASRGPSYWLGGSDQLAHASAWGGMAIYTPDGKLTPGQPPQAMFTAGWGLRTVPEDQRVAFVTEHIGTLDADLVGLSLAHQHAVEYGGLPGYETQAEGRSLEDGTTTVLWETILFAEGRYAVMTGVCGADVAETYVPAFRDKASGFELN